MQVKSGFELSLQLYLRDDCKAHCYAQLGAVLLQLRYALATMDIPSVIRADVQDWVPSCIQQQDVTIAELDT